MTQSPLNAAQLADMALVTPEGYRCPWCPKESRSITLVVAHMRNCNLWG